MTVLLKLGGSAITDKSQPYTARRRDMERLAIEIKGALSKDSGLKLIIGNGGGSFPHQPAKKGKLVDGISEPWQLEHLVETQRAASELNQMLVTILIKAGVPAFSIRPSSAGYARDGEIAEFNLKPIEELLKLGAVPVIHGDVMMDIRKGCSIASTEKLFSYIVSRINIERIIIGTNVDGVLDDKNRVIPGISKKTFESIKQHLKGAKTTDVTGGMLHKVESMLQISKYVSEIRIVNASKEGNVKKALEGEALGTRITYN